jgi:mRNA interferase HigB
MSVVGPKAPIAVKIGSDDAKDSITFSRRQIASMTLGNRLTSWLPTRPAFPIGEIFHVPKMGICYTLPMQIIAKSTLRKFWEIHPQAETPLKTWYAIVGKAAWSGPADVKKMFGVNVDFVSDNRIIFDISGNRYRLMVRIAYPYQRVLAKFVGTHKEYNDINPETA